MNIVKSITIRSRAYSFRYATAGILKLLRMEPNMRIHVAATLFAITCGVIKGIAVWQWVAIVGAIALVWITEAINTSIEQLSNVVCDNKFHPVIKVVKDVAAGAVLFAAIASVCVGLLIFLN